jgi:serine/threonine protein kinase
MILSTLGKPTYEELGFLSDENAKQYLRSIECRQKKGFDDMFPQMPKAVIDILNTTMSFDPRTRATVDKVLEHEFFADCRRKEAEFTREPFEMEFEVGE